MRLVRVRTYTKAVASELDRGRVWRASEPLMPVVVEHCISPYSYHPIPCASVIRCGSSRFVWQRASE